VCVEYQVNKRSFYPKPIITVLLSAKLKTLSLQDEPDPWTSEYKTAMLAVIQREQILANRDEGKPSALRT
jgi:hypothetical protein